MKNSTDRKEIAKAIFDKYKAFHRENIYGKSQKIPIHLDDHKVPDGILSIEKFKGGIVNPDVLANKLGVEKGSATHRELIQYVTEANNIQRVVSKTMQNPDKIINWEDEGVKPEEWLKAILANQDPPIHKVQYSDLGSDSLKIALNIAQKQDFYPEEVAKYLTVNEAMSYKNEGSLNYFAEQALMYQYVSNFFPNIDYPPIYEQAINAGAVDFIANKEYGAATEIFESLKDDTYKERFQSIVKLSNVDTFGKLIDKKIKSPNVFAKLFANEKDPMHKHMLSQADQSVWFSVNPRKLMGNAYNDMETMFNTNIARMTRGKKINPWSKDNEALREKAWNKTLKQMKDAGWGVNIHTKDGEPRLVKNPYWHTYGPVDPNDVYMLINKTFHTQSKAEQMSTFNTNNWDDIKNKYNQWANDSSGNIKISINKRHYKDKDNNDAYALTLWDGDTFITFDDDFKPAGWVDLTKQDDEGVIINSTAQLTNHTTNEIYENLIQSKLFNNEIAVKSIGMMTNTNPQMWSNIDQKKNWTKRALHYIIRNGIKLGDFKWYPDIEVKTKFFGEKELLVDEVKPFAWIARMVGFDGDLREISSELQNAASIANENLSFQKKLRLNRDLSDTEKITESRLPPEKMTMREYDLSRTFKLWAMNNYQNEELRLTHRTNNWTAVSSDNWDGEIPLNYKRDSRHFAVFSHPKDSIRAAVKSILNHSILTANLNTVDIRYGSEPTVEDILTMYAEDTTSYLKSLNQHTNLEPTDTIDLMNNNELHNLMKFIIQHEMGIKYFIEKFGNNNPYVDSVIFKGINEAINSYNGELGKL